ncbi:hypothetical protein EDC04DRAFT_2864584 [Pisolithus marmoratus]|nr:hypothetical protein EDC04DRAFT_2864584 [Pisolithus marmoratus]
MPTPGFRVSRPAKDPVHYPDYDHLSPESDQMIFGPLDLEEHTVLPHSSLHVPWDPSRDYAFGQPVSPILSDQAMSPRRSSDFDVPDASPAESPLRQSSVREPSTTSIHSSISRTTTYLNGSTTPTHSIRPPSSPIPIRPGHAPTQSNPLLMSYLPQNASFSPSDLAALHSLPRSLSPTDRSDGYLSSPSLTVASISPADTSLRPPSWASQLWDPSLYHSSTNTSGRSSTPHRPLSGSPHTAKKQRFQPRREINPSSPMFQAVQRSISSAVRRANFDPQLQPSCGVNWIQRHQATSTRKLNVAQAAKEAGQEYANLTPEQKEEIKRENAFRTAQRKAGRSRKSNLKDLNAPKKPLSAYFMFLQHIREIFGDEQETTKQSVLAAAKWRSMTDDERKPFLAQAEQEKLEYEAARRLYEEGTTGLPNNINFSILPNSPSDSPFHIFRNVKSESFSSESESEGMTPDDGSRYTRF